MTLAGGLDYAIAPTFSLRAALTYRQGFSSAELESKELPNVVFNAGTSSALKLGVSGSYTF